MKFKQAGKSLVALAMLGTLSLGGAAFANHDCGGDGKCHHGMSKEDKKEKMDEFFDAVDLTDAQKEQMKNLHQQFEARTRPLMDDLHQRKMALMTYTMSTSATQAEAIRRQTEIQNLEAQIGRMKIEQAFAKKAILTPDQQVKANAFIQEQMKEHQEKRMEKMKEHDAKMLKKTN